MIIALLFWYFDININLNQLNLLVHEYEAEGVAKRNIIAIILARH